MKKTIKIFGIIALVAVIGLSMVGCKADDDDDGGGNSLTITGLGDFNGKFVCASGYSDIDDPNLITSYADLIAAESFNISNSNSSVTAARINNGKATLKVWKIKRTEDNISTANYTGNGPAVFVAEIYSSANLNYNNKTEARGYVPVTFSNGSGEGLYTIPPAPTGVSALATSSSSITVTWDEVHDVVEYYIYRSSSESGTYTLVSTQKTNSYTNNGLSEGTTYYYKISSSNRSGESNISLYASATTHPKTPTGIQATATSTSSITVIWDVVSSADGYNVYRSFSSSGEYTLVGTTAATSYTDNDLSAGTTYFYKITATKNESESVQSSIVSEKTISLNAPTGVSATAIPSSRAIYVSWDAVSGATRYYVYRSSSETDTYIHVGTTIDLSYIDTGLLYSTTYYYKVSAYNNNGEGVLSSIVSETSSSPGGNPPSNPSGITWESRSSTTTSLTISWNKVNSIDGYYVYRSSSATGVYNRVATVTTESYTDTNLSAGMIFYYKVSAYNSDGESSQTEYAGAATRPNPPTGVKAVLTYPRVIRVTWNSVPNATRYEVSYAASTSSQRYYDDITYPGGITGLIAEISAIYHLDSYKYVYVVSAISLGYNTVYSTSVVVQWQ